MKLNTALKLSALAVAMGLTTVVNAATLNSDSLLTNPGATWNDVATDNAAQDKSQHQFVDLGSMVKPGEDSEPTGQTSVLNELFKNNDGEYFIKKTPLNGASEFYKVDVEVGSKNVNGNDVENLIIDMENKVALDVDPTLGLDRILSGLSLDSSYETTSSTDIKVVDSNFLQYGQETAKENSVEQGQGFLVNDGRDADTGDASLYGQFSEYEDKNEKEVLSSNLITVGDVSMANKTGTEATADHVPEYGVLITEEDKKAGTVDEAKLNVNGLTLTQQKPATGDTPAINDSTIITAQGIETTGTIKINGVDVAKDLAAATTTANAAQTTATEAKTVADAANTTANAAQTTATEAKTVANAANTTAGEAKDLAQTANTTATEAKTVANAADTKATNALTAVQDIDNKFVQVGSRVDQLNKRVDDVEKTAYRGVAIALAAQQNVPNIKPGQFAVFGGVGHYESESAFAMGVVGAINERTSISGAIGVAGGSEVGGRVGVAYVFGGK